MTYYYKLPHDIYCWEQDRGGTLIPLISQIFHKFLGFSAINSVSITNYFILILGYIGFSSLFKNKFTKLIFSIVWFFPPVKFIDLIRYPLGIQYSLIGFSIFILNNIDFKNKKLLINHVLIVFTILLFSISIWVSDLAIVTITSLVLVLFLFPLFYGNVLKHIKLLLTYLLIGIAGNFLFIMYAKRLAISKTKNYTTFNDLDTLFQGIKILTTELFNIMAFQTEEFFLSIYSWSVLFCIILCIKYIRTKKLSLSTNTQKWLTFFIVDFVAVFGVILASKWVFLNGMGRWYFIPSYISFSMVIFLIFDNLKLEHFKRLLVRSILFLTVFVGAISTIHYFKYINPKTFRSKIDVKAEFLTLGEIGIIGNFWNSYIASCPDPAKIKATTHDKGVIRNQKLVDEVFAQPKLYVIKDMWMQSFPDTLKQFGYILIKNGTSFKIGNCDVNRYKKIKRDEIIPFNSFKYNPAVQITKNKIELLKNSPSLKNKYVSWGPYWPIGIGDFVLTYKVKIKDSSKGQPIAKLNVVANYGKTIIAKKELIIKELDSNGNGHFNLEFSTDKRYTNIEFSIYYYGNCDLIIEKIQLTEI
jgi:hypothetical protein